MEEMELRLNLWWEGVCQAFRRVRVHGETMGCWLYLFHTLRPQHHLGFCSYQDQPQPATGLCS